MKKHKLLVVALALTVVLGAFAGCTTDDPIGEQMEEEAAYYQGEIGDAAELQYALDEGIEDITLQDDIEADEIEASSEFSIDGDGYRIDAKFKIDIDEDDAEFENVSNINEVEVESVGSDTLTVIDSNVRRINIREGAAGASINFAGTSRATVFFTETSISVEIDDEADAGRVYAVDPDDVEGVDAEEGEQVPAIYHVVIDETATDDVIEFPGVDFKLAGSIHNIGDEDGSDKSVGFGVLTETGLEEVEPGVEPDIDEIMAKLEKEYDVDAGDEKEVQEEIDWAVDELPADEEFFAVMVGDNYDISEESLQAPEGTVYGYVTDSRGGPGLEGASVEGNNAEYITDEDGYFQLNYFSDVDEPFDIIVEKENYGQVKAQDIQLEDRETLYLELPARENFNPDWSLTPPDINVEGVERGETVSGELEIEFEIEGDRPTFVYYVNFGGLQRGPREAFDVDTDEGTAVIDTSRFPDGESFIRILAYDDNDNTIMKVIPVVVDNDIVDDEVPGDMSWMGLTSISTGENLGMYVNQMEEIEEEMDEDINTDIYETPEGNQIDLSQIPDDSSLFVEVEWEEVPGADGYSVYRSFDGDDFRHIGNITEKSDISTPAEEEELVWMYNDYSPQLSQRETHYKVVPYNDAGEGKAITRTITPLAPHNVIPETPEHDSTDVDLDPTFSWSYDVKGEWPEGVQTIDAVSLFESTDWLVFEDIAINANEYKYEEDLEPNTVYSWDVYYSEAFLYEEDEAGFTDAVSVAGGQDGSLIGEFMFTTTKDYSTPDDISEILSYEELYDDADQNSILVKSSDLNSLEDNLEVINKWEAIDWARVRVPSGQDLAEFTAEVSSKGDVLMAQPNLAQELPDYEKMSERDAVESEAPKPKGVDIGAEDYEKRLWGMENINAEDAWEKTTGNDDVVVAIVDTGVDMEHPEFANNEFVAPFNATGDEGPGAIDLQGHGTHVAGTAVADGRTGNIAGVSWDNPIMPIRVMDEEGFIYSDYTIEGIMHIVDFMQENDVRVVANYSIGGRGYDAAMKDALDYAMDEGLIWVTSAGNDGKRVPNLPATYNGLISTAASTPHDAKADFSTTGFWNSVAAPGVTIWSTYPTYIDEDGYAYLQGTSMASPHVTGAAALLLSENPDLSAPEVLNRVEQTAQETVHGSSFTEELGHGILDAEALLTEEPDLEYGSLNIVTDKAGAKMTVFDDDDLVAFAAVGSALERQIHALEEGDYTVKLTYVEPEEENDENEIETELDPGESITITEDISITADDITEVEMMFETE